MVLYPPGFSTFLNPTNIWPGEMRILGKIAREQG
jgi:hypothetical protein